MRKLFVLFGIVLIVQACAEQASEEACADASATNTGFLHPDSIVNPNGDSELSLVMRHFHFEANKVANQIKKGEPVDLMELRTLAIRLQSAKPTDEAVLDETYFQLTETMLGQIEALNHGAAVEFNNLVGTCIACHKNTCPGPLVKIKKLMIES